MTVFSLLAALVRRAPFSWAFHAIGLAVAIAVLGSVLILQRAADERMARDLARVDLVVGAKGSPLQLVASTLFQVDAPTGNIPLTTLDGLSRDPLVHMAVPVSLGDSVGGSRIVGTSTAHADLYGATLAQGAFWTGPMEAVLGAEKWLKPAGLITRPASFRAAWIQSIISYSRLVCRNSRSKPCRPAAARHRASTSARVREP
jgi:putative ABC transport system permease protein